MAQLGVRVVVHEAMKKLDSEALGQRGSGANGQ
jgi:hypothetical protein